MSTAWDYVERESPPAGLPQPRLLRPVRPTPLPSMSARDLFDEVERSGLTGRGGAAFPTHRKLAAVLAGPGPRIVIGNGAEGEPASRKDMTLLRTNPHAVLDGLHVAATIVDAARVFLYLHDDDDIVASVLRALAERRAAGGNERPVEIRLAPHRFVSGEESAVASAIEGGPALPRSKPPRVFECGAFGRPTLVQNVETLAQLAFIARHGAAEFRSVGPADQPGTMLFTISGAVRRPGVVEAPVGTSLDDLLVATGGLSARVQAVLLGGYHGSWVRWPAARFLSLANGALRPQGLSVGAGVVVALPEDACGPTEVARVLNYLAQESAGQCGPCVFGLPALASAYAGLVTRSRSRRHGERLAGVPALLERRGGCSHPDGTLRFVRSAQTVFAEHLDEHRRHVCPGRLHPAVLPIPTD